MIICVRTNSENDDFQKLVKELDADLAVRDGAEHAFYDQYNKIDAIKYALVAYDNATPVGCGAIKEFASDSVEVKRMYVLPNRRGQGIASIILIALEQWAAELNYTKCVLETGKRQPEAIALYTKRGYAIIPNFGQYENIANSVCFEKLLS
jgi:putative acetyltransferase